MCVLNAAGTGIRIFTTLTLTGDLLLLAGFSRDTFGELSKRAAEGIAAVCAEETLQEALVPYAAALARVSMPNLRHRHARVRKAAVDAVRRREGKGGFTVTST